MLLFMFILIGFWHVKHAANIFHVNVKLISGEHVGALAMSEPNGKIYFHPLANLGRSVVFICKFTHLLSVSNVCMLCSSWFWCCQYEMQSWSCWWWLYYKWQQNVVYKWPSCSNIGNVLEILSSFCFLPNLILYFLSYFDFLLVCYCIPILWGEKEHDL